MSRFSYNIVFLIGCISPELLNHLTFQPSSKWPKPSKSKHIIFFLIERHGEYFFILVLCCAFLGICIMHRLLFLMGKASTQAIYSIVGPEFLELPTRKKPPYWVCILREQKTDSVHANFCIEINKIWHCDLYLQYRSNCLNKKFSKSIHDLMEYKTHCHCLHSRSLYFPSATAEYFLPHSCKLIQCKLFC